MGNLKAIKNRIEGVKSTRQITNAMKMVAASKLRKSQEAIEAARPYANLVGGMLECVKKKNSQSIHPFFLNKQTGKSALVVVTSDRGLCGSFNSEIVKRVKAHLAENENVDVICVGKNGTVALKKVCEVYSDFTGLFNSMDFSVAKDITEIVLDLYLNKEYEKVDVIYNKFVSAIQQDIIFKGLFPIEPSNEEGLSLTDFLYEPDEDAIVEELGRKFISVEIWRILLESSAAEQAARMTAMDNATENASEIIDSLSLKYNRERQAAITGEIIDIVGGAEAINE